MNSAFLDYYRCPAFEIKFRVNGELTEDTGYFNWGVNNICYGRTTHESCVSDPRKASYDASNDITVCDSSVFLPFDYQEVIENLQRERYSEHFCNSSGILNTAIRAAYYSVRPYLGIAVRKHLQRLRLRGWQDIVFPQWPVDLTLDRIQRKLMALAIRASGEDAIPFIWFWPDGHRGCVIVTHDVEEASGRDFCGHLMDIDEAFGFRASFQVVPESRYHVPSTYLAQIRARGFEVNVHDLSHDGRLFNEHEKFLRSVKKINEYGKEFDAIGFRSGALYRNADWLEALDFVYDMSIPNVAHLDPQRGGCCTVFPYFIGKLVELPLTCTQDYTLFHMLGSYSMSIWEQQIQTILENDGLITVLAHPDYLKETKETQAYMNLLRHLARMRTTSNLWSPLPKEVALWWRQRNAMQLVRNGNSWHIDGPGRERASVAYAVLDGDDVSYRF